MLNLGDVWAITAVIVGMAVCTWALLLCLALIFQRRTKVARDLVAAHPGVLIGTGLLITLFFGFIGVLLLQAPQPAVKLLGWLVLLSLMAISFAGSAGLVSLAGERVQELDPNLSRYAALSKGALFVVLPSIMPILGWFFYAPVVFCLGVGAGIRVLRVSAPEPLEAMA